MLTFHLRALLSWSKVSIRLFASDRRTRPRAKPTPATAPPLRYGGYIAGLQYYDGSQLLHRLRRGMVLRLVRDRHNRHDPDAIRIMAGTRMLGFVPRGPNAQIARRIDQAEAMLCRIERIDPRTKPWKQVEICIESQSIARPWWGECELDDDPTDDSRLIFTSDRDQPLTFEDAGFE